MFAWNALMSKHSWGCWIYYPFMVLDEKLFHSGPLEVLNSECWLLGEPQLGVQCVFQNLKTLKLIQYLFSYFSTIHAIKKKNKTQWWCTTWIYWIQLCCEKGCDVMVPMWTIVIRPGGVILYKTKCSLQKLKTGEPSPASLYQNRKNTLEFVCCLGFNWSEWETETLSGGL